MFNKNIKIRQVEKINFSSKKAFTFVELLIVSIIAMFLLALSVPMISSLRSTIEIKKTIVQVKTDLLMGMAYSLAGKSMAALSKDNLKDTSLIPSFYALYFIKADDYGEENPYYYKELGTKVSGNIIVTKDLYSIKKELPSPVVYLSSIKIKKDIKDEGREVNDVLIMFSPPLGKIIFLANSSGLVQNTDYLAAFASSKDNRILELSFKYKDEDLNTETISISTSKVIEIL